MALSLRTATKGVIASGATASITLPTGTTTGDLIVVGFANAGTSGPSTPVGWKLARTTDSAGSGQSITVFFAPYSAGLTLSFVNAASVTAWTCQTVTGGPNTGAVDTTAATSSVTNNTTLPTGAPTTGALAGDVELLFYAWISAATISVVAAGSTIDATQANSTSVSCATGHNNTLGLGSTTATTAFSQTLSASNTRKTGVGVNVKLLSPTLATPGLLTTTTATFAPVKTVAGTVTPGIVALSTSLLAPTVSAPRVVTPGTATLSLTGFSPAAVAPQLATPGVKNLTLSTFSPNIPTPRVVTPGTAVLVSNRLAPTVSSPRVTTPGVKNLSTSTFSPAISAPRRVVPNTTPLIITPFAPVVSVPRPGIYTPGTTSLTLATFAPTPRVSHGYIGLTTEQSTETAATSETLTHSYMGTTTAQSVVTSSYVSSGAREYSYTGTTEIISNVHAVCVGKKVNRGLGGTSFWYPDRNTYACVGDVSVHAEVTSKTEWTSTSIRSQLIHTRSARQKHVLNQPLPLPPKREYSSHTEVRLSSKIQAHSIVQTAAWARLQAEEDLLLLGELLLAA